MANQVIWASYPTAAVVVVLFGVFAGLYTHYRHKKAGQDTTEFFLTARRSVVRIPLLMTRRCLHCRLDDSY